MDMSKEFKKRDSFIHWFLIASITGIKITDELKSEPREVTMQLNGVEIDPKRALMRLEDDLKSLVKTEASEMVDDIKNDILSPLEDQVEEMTSAIKEMVDKNCH